MQLLKKSCLLVLGLAMLVLARPMSVLAATADPVLEWIGIMNDTVLAGGTNPLVTSRVVALVSASLFDAVNGIDGRLQPIHVEADAPRCASERAAAVQAAYAMLLKLYPAQSDSLTMHRNASIAAITEGNPHSVQAGIAWGQQVADSIWDWRSTDGFNPPAPPFVGVLGIVGSPSAIGVWRPTPLVNAPGAGPQFATMTPWTMRRPSQFRPAPPPALTSAAYNMDYNEIKIMGVFAGSQRTADQSELALFWAGNTALYWNRIASQIATARNLSLTENAHLFAQLNLSMADAAIACWDAKYRYVFWRPITAIVVISTAMPPPLWTPLGRPGSIFSRPEPHHIPNIPPAIRRSAVPQPLSSRPRLETTLHSQLRPTFGRVRDHSRASPPLLRRSPTRAFSAESTTGTPACKEMRSAVLWLTMSCPMPCVPLTSTSRQLIGRRT